MSLQYLKILCYVVERFEFAEYNNGLHVSGYMRVSARINGKARFFVRNTRFRVSVPVRKLHACC